MNISLEIMSQFSSDFGCLYFFALKNILALLADRASYAVLRQLLFVQIVKRDSKDTLKKIMMDLFINIEEFMTENCLLEMGKEECIKRYHKY